MYKCADQVQGSKYYYGGTTTLLHKWNYCLVLHNFSYHRVWWKESLLNNTYFPTKIPEKFNSNTAKLKHLHCCAFHVVWTYWSSFRNSGCFVKLVEPQGVQRILSFTQGFEVNRHVTFLDIFHTFGMIWLLKLFFLITQMADICHATNRLFDA